MFLTLIEFTPAWIIGKVWNKEDTGVSFPTSIKFRILDNNNYFYDCSLCPNYKFILTLLTGIKLVEKTKAGLILLKSLKFTTIWNGLLQQIYYREAR